MTKLPDYSNKKFLIVDDMPFMLNLIHRMLKECGASNIYKAADGRSALKMMANEVSPLDFIIADCNMKPLNGLQLLKAIRSGSDPRIPRDQPFVMLTGQRDAAVVKSAIMLDVNGYLVKPASLEKLIKTVDRATGNPIVLRGAAYYQAVNIPTINGFEDLGVEDPDKPQKISAWVIMPKSVFRHNQADLKSKTDAFRIKHATRDGDFPPAIANVRRCDLAELVDGMVLGEDIHADEDHILLRRGVRLTKGMIERLRELAVESGSRDCVWVGTSVS